MSQATHRYGPTCHLARSVASSASKDNDIPGTVPLPKSRCLTSCDISKTITNFGIDLKAQFFYSSPLPLDDPLSVVPTPTGSVSVKHPPRPFAAGDNNALEEAWLGLASEKDRKNHNKFKHTTSSTRPNASDPISNTASPSEDKSRPATHIPEISSQGGGEAGTTGLPFLKYSSRSG